MADTHMNDPPPATPETQTYILRVYRRDTNDASEITGVLELPITDQSAIFHGYDELRTLLASGPGFAQRDSTTPHV